MSRSSKKHSFFLLGALCIIIYLVLYKDITINSNSILTLSEDEANWLFTSATQQEEETIEASCSLRKAVRNVPVFRRNFRFSVPVLQWMGSLSTPTWVHLKNYGPPYGWKRIPMNVVNSTLSLLNSSNLFDRGLPDRCVRCAVVGNGGILRGSKQGKNIDSHDLVFRMNGAIIKGFEEDVGTKISFYGFTTNTMKNSLKAYKKEGFTEVPQDPDTKYIFIPTDVRDYVMLKAALQNETVPSGTDKGDRPWRYFGHKPPESFKILHPEFISYVTHRFFNSSRMTDNYTRNFYRPTTGALTLLTALHTCDQVSAYGFVTRNYAAFSDHYYDSKKQPLIFYGNHDLEMERVLWERLHLQKVITLYQRKEDN